MLQDSDTLYKQAYLQSGLVSPQSPRCIHKQHTVKANCNANARSYSSKNTESRCMSETWDHNLDGSYFHGGVRSLAGSVMAKRD